ncbi:hypothetical protein HMPREF3170_05720 [Corynebacterium sp. HMSC08D02]|uniref:AMP-binding protein n=1 Tax=Corynebacterium sp. HMSC08D02 TaxID=1581138 RepID=UPI0008A278CD|nr:AMP-binding protein [Corynebacterium sp. HMSC08D02]OFT29891.1 hypothetical protein HMPREF3170_05720 [Corynebacterium sp. HMSC08D02]
MTYESPLPPIPDVGTRARSITDLLFGNLGEHASAPALTEVETGRSVTYAQLHQEVLALAATLRSRGIGPGDCVAVQLPNGIDFAVTFLALVQVGASASLLGTSLTATERDHLCALAEAKVLLDAPIAPTEPPERSASPAGPEDIAAVAFSSGTTGLPKAVELTHRNLCANMLQFSAALRASGIGAGTPTLAPLPFAHIYGLNTLLLSSLYARHHIHTMAAFDLNVFIEAQRSHRIELSFIAPPIALALSRPPEATAEAFADSRFMVCGAAPLDAALADSVEQRLGTVILQGYGTTETSPVTHVGIAGRSKPGSIGFAVPNTQFRIIDLRDGHDVAPGEPGEMLIRGPQVMRGYRNDPEATQATITGGWLHTGDIVTLAEDGTVYIVDRAKEVIKYKGFHVAPAELEALLRTHPAVADAAVVRHIVRTHGVDCEVPRACIVVADGATLSREEIMEWVAERVAGYKKIREVTFTDHIPRNAAGKILRREL